jgi:hypothetical protein
LVQVKLLNRIDDDKRRGGGYADLARFNERLLREHQRASRDETPRCVACDDRWPCAMVASILAHD